MFGCDIVIKLLAYREAHFQVYPQISNLPQGYCEKKMEEVVVCILPWVPGKKTGYNSHNILD